MALFKITGTARVASATTVFIIVTPMSAYILHIDMVCVYNTVLSYSCRLWATPITRVT